MFRVMLIAAAGLALAACQPSRPGPYYGGGYGAYQYEYGPDHARANAAWYRRERERWDERTGADQARPRSWAEERYRRTGYIAPADYGQPWVPREPRYGYGEP